MFFCVLPRALYWPSSESTYSWNVLPPSPPPISCVLPGRCSRVFCLRWLLFIISRLGRQRTARCVREEESCACRRWTAHFPRGLSYRAIWRHPRPDDARRGCCSEEGSCRRSAVPCTAVVLHFYPAIEPLIKRHHMQLISTLTPQIKFVWVNAAADRIWTSTRGQHAQIEGRFYNDCEKYLLDLDTWHKLKVSRDVCIDSTGNENH